MKIHPNYQLSTYRYSLPESLIAHEPLQKRDASRLMIVRRKSRTVEHGTMKDLPRLLNEHHVLIANNTKVFKARLSGDRIHTQNPSLPGGKVEFFLLKKVSEDGLTWQGMMRSSAMIQPGFEFKIQNLKGRVIERIETSNGAYYVATFSENPLSSGMGEVPLPPYIVAKRKALTTGEPARGQNEELEFYNTVFSKEEGSVAAPTAGRHFTPELLEQLKDQGVEWHEVTLHVGIGTFKPVTAEDIREHPMHYETATVSVETAKAIESAKAAGKKIVAVGTTSVRTLEGFARLREDGKVMPGTEDLNLFIHPGEKPYDWRVVDAMITNFHVPESSLLMMIAEFIGSPQWTIELYEEAIRQKYRFYSYGDAMLIID